MLALTDFDELKALLNLEKDDLDDYPQLAAIITSVYAAIETYIGRTLQYGEHTETVWLDGDRLIPLKALPVESVESVTIDSLDATLAATIISDGLRMAGRYSGRADTTYTGGFETAPDGLKRAAMLQVQHEFQRKDHVGAESVSNEGGFTKWPQMGLLEEVKRMLNPFRHPAVLV